MTRTAAALTFMLAGFLVPGATAQQIEPTESRALEIGPLTIRPRLDIREVGFDDNVFNDAENPQSDFTATISPRVDAGLRLGWTRLTYASVVDAVYFRKFTGERSFNRATEARFEVGEGTLQPFVFGSVADTHARLNAEIDARAGRRQAAYGGGLAVVLTGRTKLGLSVRRATLDFADGASYRGVDLGGSMDGRNDQFDASIRIALTPLTTWSITAGGERERFDRSAARDADSYRITTGFDFSPSALIAGNATVGYRRFTPLSATLAGYEGVVAQGGLTYAQESTKLEAQFERDVRFSFEELEPYYLSTGGRITATQRVAGPVDVQGTAGRYNMAYREFDAGDAASRRDWTTVYGGGMGFRFGDIMRLGVNAEWSRRRSDERSDRRYDRRRVFASLSYGF
jgi:hypothetical protein